MEREVSHIVELAVTLILLAAVVGIIMFTVNIGNTTKADSAEAITDIRQSISTDYIKDFIRGRTSPDMPSATAYNILTTYKGVITHEASTFDSQVRILNNEDSILKDNLKGKVRLEIKELPDGRGQGSGQFIAFVQPLNFQGEVIRLADSTNPTTQKFVTQNATATNIGLRTLATEYNMTELIAKYNW